MDHKARQFRDRFAVVGIVIGALGVTAIGVLVCIAYLLRKAIESAVTGLGD